MRLIDADELIKDRVGNDTVVVVAKCAPTAYDVDKVIKRLEDKAIEELGIDRGKFAIDKGEYSSYCSLTLEDVIEIVKSGGI